MVDPTPEGVRGRRNAHKKGVVSIERDLADSKRMAVDLMRYDCDEVARHISEIYATVMSPLQKKQTMGRAQGLRHLCRTDPWGEPLRGCLRAGVDIFNVQECFRTPARVKPPPWDGLVDDCTAVARHIDRVFLWSFSNDETLAGIVRGLRQETKKEAYDHCKKDRWNQSLRRCILEGPWLEIIQLCYLPRVKMQISLE